MSPNISVNFILEGTKAKKDGTYPIKLNVYNKQAGQKRYGTKLSATKDGWEKLDTPRLRDDDLKELKIQLAGIRQKAIETIDSLPFFSFTAFEDIFFEPEKNIATTAGSLQVLFDAYVASLKKNGQIGTAISYNTTINSINDFKKGMTIFDITPKRLLDYENHLKSKGNSISTIGIYMRQLRAVVNKAIEDKIFPQESYPFKKYQIPAGRNIKKALSNEELKKILSHTPDENNQQKALAFWKLSYFCNGMNFTDIIHLERKSYDGKFFHFFREKTKRTKKKDLRPIRVAVNEAARNIIEQYKCKDNSTPYLFPILEPGLSNLTIKHRCQRFIKWVNKYMEEIRVELKFEKSLTTYAARHSFTTILIRKGVAMSFVKESLGHTSVITTENYVGDFEDETKIEYANLLNLK
ncbi:phage integrase SAM-like domain-containing protein [Niabella hirudinis]|uniref:phage integrase SAM-like domain-containing protein n=1 Tax=Niabella hirudinis TaxID=1285929 RepID=UPI003EBA5CCB